MVGPFRANKMYNTLCNSPYVHVHVTLDTAVIQKWLPELDSYF